MVRIEFDGDKSRHWRVLRDSHGNYEVDTNLTDFSSEFDDRADTYDADTDFPDEDEDEDEDEEYVYWPLSLRGLIKLLDGLHTPVSPVNLGIDGTHLTDGANTKFRYESSLYPQLQAFMVARARHWLQHHEWVDASNIPIDVARFFGKFDFAFRPETYWGEGSAYITENDVGAEEIQPDEVEIASVGISYDDLSGTTIMITAYRDPDYVEIADEDIEDDDEEGGQDREKILYRSVSPDDNGYWTGHLSHSSNEPLAFWEMIDVLDGSGIETELESEHTEEAGNGVSATWSFSSDVYPELESFIDLRSELFSEYDTWIRLDEILKATGYNPSTSASS